MTVIVLRVAAVAAGVAGALLAASGVAAASPGAEQVTTYDTRIDVTADGRLHVAETVDYDFGPADRHGIIRRIPTTFPYDDTRDRVYPVDDISATMDGRPVPLDRSTEDGYTVVKIGRSDVTVRGLHRYI